MIRKVICPHCGKWLFSVDVGTTGTVYVWCRSCRQEIKIDIKEPLSH